mmetsp:Transcript_2143/g.4808  ORF Transcript_2143/g.4808 Transcript_2143/m.4808 type:complete len:166 (-) Transcript_2143:110-607(-)
MIIDGRIIKMHARTNARMGRMDGMAWHGMARDGLTIGTTNGLIIDWLVPPLARSLTQESIHPPTHPLARASKSLGSMVEYSARHCIPPMSCLRVCLLVCVRASLPNHFRCNIDRFIPTRTDPNGAVRNEPNLLGSDSLVRYHTRYILGSTKQMVGANEIATKMVP